MGLLGHIVEVGEMPVIGRDGLTAEIAVFFGFSRSFACGLPF